MLVEDFIAERINELCSKRQISRYKLSKLTGIQQSTLSNLMTKKSLPNIVTLSRICDGLGITLSQFFQEGDNLPDLSSEQKRVLDTWAELSETEKILTSTFVRGLLHK